jgi:hypothetical protein
MFDFVTLRVVFANAPEGTPASLYVRGNRRGVGKGNVKGCRRD